MNNLIKLSFLAVILFLTSCTDPCEDITCLNDGVCDDGTCLCEDGYDGITCETEVRTKYFGTFNGPLNCPNEDPVDQSLIFEAGPEVTQMLMIDALEPTTVDTLTLEGNVATSPEREIDLFGTIVTFQISFTFNTTDEASMELKTSADGLSTTCNGTLIRQ